MLLTVLGPPSQFSSWAVPAIQSILRATVGQFDFVQVSTAARFREDWQKRKAKHTLLFSDSPDIEVAKVLKENPGPTIFLEADPLSTALYRHGCASQEPIAAARTASLSFATLHDIVLTCSNLRMISHCSAAGDFVRDVSAFYRVPLNDDQLARVLQEIGDPAPVEPIGTPLPMVEGKARNWDSEEALPDDEGVILSTSLLPFSSVYRAQVADGFVWPRSVFLGVDSRGIPLKRPPDREIELVGPARVLIYGPYFHLPVGTWQATLRFHVSSNQSGNELFTEVLSGLQVIAQATSQLPPDGTYELRVRFAVAEPREPLELRMSITRGAIEGLLGLHEVSIRRSSDEISPQKPFSERLTRQ